jgi:mono/diheme cytochrome c family protein
MGTTRAGFEQVAEAVYRTHPFRRTLFSLHPPEQFGCTSCHDGQGRATTKFYAHAPSIDEDVHAFHTHYWERELLRGPPGGDGTEYMEAKCRNCHGEEAELRSAIACELDVECAPLAGPVDPAKKPEVTCGVPKSEGERAARHSLMTLPGTPADVAAAEAKAVADEQGKLCVDRRGNAIIADLAPNYTAGLKIVEEAGCYGCHQIAGFEDLPKPAPDLTRVAHKLDPAYAISWIQDPRAHRPNTRMPKFWPEMEDPEVYPFRVDVAEVENKRVAEATAMAAFLLSQSAASQKYPYVLEPIPAGLRGDKARGAQLMADVGCAGCHNLPDGKATPKRVNRASHFDHGPDLSDVGAKTSREWIYSWLRDPKRYAPGTRMPNLRLTPQEAVDITEYLATLRGKGAAEQVTVGSLTDPALLEQGRALVKTYGCYGCHMVEGFESEPGIGADLSAFGVKLPERLDFGDFITDHNQQSWSVWTYNKLKHPRAYSYKAQAPVQTLMPQFGLEEPEVRSVMVFLKSMRGTEDFEGKVLADTLDASEKARAAGRKLIRTYNCYGCHNVDGHTGELASLWNPSDKDFIKAPPPLSNEGFKTQPDWLFNFLKRPFRMRPRPDVRMPTFGFSDEEATTLVSMFSAIDGAPFPFTYYGNVGATSRDAHAIGKAIFEAAECQKCHVVGELGDGPVSEEIKAPNLLMGQERLRPDWLALWLADPGALQKDTPMPAFWLAGNQMEQYMQTSAAFRAAVAGVDRETLERYTASPQLQIEAVRDYLFRMNEAAPAAAATATAAAATTGTAPAAPADAPTRRPREPADAPRRPREQGAATPR